MGDNFKTFLGLAIMGALIGIGRLLVSAEELSLRLILGRAILGSAVSILSGVVLIQFPAMPPLALLGVGSAFGIVGQQYLERMLRRRMAEAARSLSEDGEL